MSVSNQSLSVGQKIQIHQSSFETFYYYVYEYQEADLLKYVNLTDQYMGDVMYIVSFESSEYKDQTIWSAILKKKNDTRTYACDIEDALKNNEIKLL